MVSQSDLSPDSCWSVVITAAGLGTRMRSEVRKPHLQIDGVPILHRTIRRFQSTPGCGEIVVVLHPDDCDGAVAAALREELGVSKIVPGGNVRRASARAGLEATEDSFEVVLIHDAVRPNVRPEVILRVVAAVREHGAAIAAVPATETVKVVGEQGTIVSTPERDRLWFARTPQGFRRDTILAAHRRAAAEDYPCTDDAQLIEWQGGKVVIVEDDYENIKITTPGDIAVAEAIHRGRETRKAAGSVESDGVTE